MDAPRDLLSITQAADRLGLSREGVQKLVASQQIDAYRQAGAWLLDARSVERRRRAGSGAGRPLSNAMAWAVLLLASGEDEVAEELVRHAHTGSRARRWLASHSLAEHGFRLRARGEREQLDVHPSELQRILGRDDVMATGISAVALVGLQRGAAECEFYAPASARDVIISDHALERVAGPVLARWVADDIWPAIVAPRAPAAAVLLDLLEHDDPRARREAALAMSR